MDSAARILLEWLTNSHVLSSLPSLFAAPFRQLESLSRLPTAIRNKLQLADFCGRLTTNEILAKSDHSLDSIVQFSRGSGYTQYGGLPIRVRSNYPLFPQVYRHRMDVEPWPELEPYALKEGVGAEPTRLWMVGFASLHSPYLPGSHR